MAQDESKDQDPSAKAGDEAAIQFLAELMGPYFDQQYAGLARVEVLVNVAELIREPAVRVLAGDDPDDEDVSNQEASQDVLRAAVVLTHGHLEEFLRTMARVLLPQGDEACLNEIPLAGSLGRKEKFWLCKLVRHKGKLVDDLLKESVSEYIERSTYNSTEEIANLLGTLGFKFADHRKEFPVIDEMIQRRHQIVHRADRFDAADSLGLKAISPSDVSRWSKATHSN